MGKITTFVVWLLIPIVNFYVFYRFGQQKSVDQFCDKPVVVVQQNVLQPPVSSCKKVPLISPFCDVNKNLSSRRPSLEMVNTAQFDKYRSAKLAPMIFPAQTSLLNPFTGYQCNHYDNVWTSREFGSCVAVVFVNNTRIPFSSLRFDQDVNEVGVSKSNPPRKSEGPIPIFEGNVYNKNKLRPVGTFRKVPKDRGRDRFKEKMMPFLNFFNGPWGIGSQVASKLRSRGLTPGDDVVVMVVNEGEIDLFLNFACSARLHNITLDNFLVFAGSSEIVLMVEATGSLAIYHKGFASVSKKASNDYLDRVFVDMMWYKAFSVHVVLRLGFNVLFQDVDLVWFKKPYDYFHSLRNQSLERFPHALSSQIEAFFSDDGQRSLRYTPFFANSGFYYMISSPRSVYLSWAIMLSFDNVQLLGSHQNVLTTRLVEGLSWGHGQIQLLPIEEFSTGYLFHHDHDYMNKFRSHSVHPYNFHMCWTQGKPDKLNYMRKALIWYLKETCSPLSVLIPGGREFELVQRSQRMGVPQQWETLANRCCQAMPGAM